MGRIILDGSLTLGPASSEEGTFPSATTVEPLSTTPNPKAFDVATGIIARQLNSAGSFVALQGVGSTDAVTKGSFLYCKCDAPIKLRLTALDPEGGSDLVSILPVEGTMLVEFSDDGTLKLLEAKGVATLVYLVAGDS